jgi:hypothetical protein
VKARFLPSALGGLVLVVLASLPPAVLGACLHLVDIPSAAPFADLAAVARAVACAGQGVNVYAPSPCMGGGVYNYSPLLLHVRGLAALDGYARPVGVALALLFLAAQAALPVPLSRAELWGRGLGTCSVAVIFALARANLDVEIFLGALLGVWLLGGRAWARALAYALFALLAALKYYPVMLLALVARERLRHLVVLVAVLAAAGAAFLWRFGPGLLRSLAIVPHGPPLGNCFGAVDVPLAVGVWSGLAHGANAAAIGAFALSPTTRALFWVMVAGLAWRGWVRRGAYRAVLAPFTQRLLLASALLIVGCFLLAQNIDYRAIFLLLALPGLFALNARAAWVAVALMSESLFRVGALTLGTALAGRGVGMLAYLIVWAGREVLWWWLVAELLAVLLAWVELTLSGWRREMGSCK